jgi:hypothetical protein
MHLTVTTEANWQFIVIPEMNYTTLCNTYKEMIKIISNQTMQIKT